MKHSVVVAILAFASFATVSTPGFAMSQREQQEAAKRAYAESAKNHEEAAQIARELRDYAKAIRDAAIAAERELAKRVK